MEQQDKNQNQAVNQPAYPPFDDIQNLYIGPIEKAAGFLLTDQGTLPIIIWGEVLVYGQAKGETFVIERLRRVAFYGALEKPESDPRIGVFSLSGPLEEPTLESGPSGTAGIIEQLHYEALSSELEPLVKSYDAVFPQVEQIRAKLTWDQQGKPNERAVQISISFTADELVDKKLGIIQRFILNPITVNFFLAGTGAPSPEPRHSLQSNCPAPPVAGSCPAHQQTFTRSLPLKFINFSTLLSSAEVEALCNIQIQGLCEVWRNKAALQFVVQNTLIQATTAHKSSFHILTPLQENTPLGSTGTTTIEKQGYDSTTQIEIYLIDQFTVADHHGGGIGYNFGQASAYCIIDLGLLEGDKLAHPPNGSLYLYVLAHEIGHALGLAHPIGTLNFQTTGLIDSSSESIMKPANLPVSPNLTTNTLYNCRVFLPPQALSSPRAKTLNCVILNPQPPLNPILSSPGASDCFRPDPVDHMIRDYPADTGIEPSVPPGQNCWDYSNLWNRRSNTAGGLISGAPDHEEPYVCSDPTRNFINHMWVKLEQLTNLSDPVDVDLYMSVPGSSVNLVPLNPPSTSGSPNHRLKFCLPLIPANPASLSLPWVVPAGYTAHSCVYAISFSDDAPSPIPNPTSMNFGNVAPLVTAYNCIAQRNLHIQVTTCMNPRPCTTTLAWLQMENPFETPASAKLEIDATKSAQLRELLLEVDDRIVGQITPGETLTIQIADLLQSRDSKILRIHATLPPVMLPYGTELPIHLRFFVDDQLINGYTHIVRVAPLETTVVQVLDTLFGALRDVGVGYRSEFGQKLAEKARKIVINERQRAESSGCLGLLWRIFLPKSAWRSRVTNLSQGIATLAQNLNDTGEPEDDVVRRRLYELAGFLLTPKSTPAPIFLERIRELADRIQEPSGRLARQQLKV